MKKVYLFISVFLSFIPSIAQTLLSENFDGASFPPTGWTIINVSGAGLGWVDNNNANLAWAPYAAYSGTGSMVNEYDQAINANTWAISPSIPLSAGTGYSVTFYYKVEDNLYPEKMKVTVGNGASVAAQTTVLWNNNGDTSLTNIN